VREEGEIRWRDGETRRDRGGRKMKNEARKRGKREREEGELRKREREKRGDWR
jgi:hypothetical protein